MSTPGQRHKIPPELWRRYRGCKAGAKLKAMLVDNRRRFKPLIPLWRTSRSTVSAACSFWRRHGLQIAYRMLTWTCGDLQQWEPTGTQRLVVKTKAGDSSYVSTTIGATLVMSSWMRFCVASGACGLITTEGVQSCDCPLCLHPSESRCRRFLWKDTQRHSAAADATSWGLHNNIWRLQSWTPPWLLFTRLSTAPPGRTGRFSYCMPTLRKHTESPPSPYWANQTTTWYIQPQCHVYTSV